MKRNKTILQLPFKGFWYTCWGGDTKKLNHHHESKNQKYGFDFIIVDEKLKNYKGTGKNNKDYYAFGKKILAPADGTVIEAIDGVRDNKPGSTNHYFLFGNVVFIKHRKNEISILAHLKQGSVKVKAGNKVKSGQVVGLCGNSGNSTEPHLHCHLQDEEVVQDSRGVKCYFQSVKVKKKGKIENKKDYSPTKKDLVNS